MSPRPSARPRRTGVVAPAAPRALEAAVRAARLARLRAHAPYSHYLVGAAVIDERGRIHRGCNVENASYGLTICAERNAVAAAVLAGARRLTGVAVITAAEPPGTPCGACRQVLAELALPEAAVVLAGPHGKGRVHHTVAGLLPGAFTL